MKFKETKSQERLIDLMLQDGVEWSEGAKFAAQSKDGKSVGIYKSKPVRLGESWSAPVCLHFIELDELIPNWHQTIITREMWEARDGWITWHGGECPVDGDALIDVTHNSGEVFEGYIAGNELWNQETEEQYKITAYRIHKPAEQAADDERSEPCESVAVGSKCISELTVDIIAVSVIDDIEKKTAEAEKHKAELERCQGELAEMRNTLDDMLAVVGLKAVEVEKENEQLTITDWRDLRVGDVVSVRGSCEEEHEIVEIDYHSNRFRFMVSPGTGILGYDTCPSVGLISFIRRPSAN